jgi:hypothetical protein
MAKSRKYKMSRRVKSRHTRNKKRSRHSNKKRVSKGTRKHRRSRMKGGNTNSLEAVPFVPPGGGYKVGADTNGLNGGYYYNLAQPEIHAPNGTAKPSNAINVNGKPLKGGRRNRRKTKRYSRKMRGGGLIPRDLVYLYRSAGSNLGNLYKGLTGQEPNPSSNPNPMYQPEMTKSVHLDSSVADVGSIINKAQHEASL